MGFKNGAVAKVWEVNRKENFHEVKISTNRKDKESDTYKQDFCSYARFIGKANEKAKNLNGTEMIRLLEVECTNNYKKETKTIYTNYQCYDFEIFETGEGTKTDEPKTKDTQTQPDGDDFNLPF